MVKSKNLNKILVTGIAGVVLAFMIDFLDKKIDSLINYIGSMHPFPIIMIIIIVILMSIVKIDETHKNGLETFPNFIRYILDGSIVIISVIIGVLLVWYYITILSNQITLLNFLKDALSNWVFSNIVALMITIWIIMMIYSVIENIFIIIYSAYRKFNNDINDIDQRYTMLFSFLSILISILALIL